ncbi:valine--tRNA ligase [Ignavibacteria bacterium CHB1]|nr:MAG: valine--tRNA ligase [Chlorobiota bacterium]MBV6398711.1 Valine--tRNA ligase [Ignavibacteria bacterium]MCE7952091.1 valine--tRNA ligase [Chlorobi bacterium CHB7]MDL1886352.1 valine--tRNA ligase [Ignavibacteria bacterium CHB1]RIK48800.1 MAG: valine--tRNA ligase [Ignavibacteriota bacterium]
MNEFDKTYDFKKTEQKWRNFWEDKKLYNSKPNPGKEKYSVVIPPPNVTGVLHIGHILNTTIQDIYCRYKRLKGFEVCWVPGTDHAGIATQQKVVEQITKSGKSKSDYTREEFLMESWKWKEKHGGHILKQLRRLGASVDWSKEKFTLDEDLSRAVINTFVDLYNKGYIYKGKRIINWDPVALTALSDDEIVYKEKADKLYYIKYFLEDSDKYILIATVRPETMLGDTAVAVNPNDERYKEFVGKYVILPIAKRRIKIIADNYVDPDFGSGALKITPAHDPNDFEIGKRHHLEVINVLTQDSRMNENGLQFEGLNIFEARKKIVELLNSEGLIDKTEEYVHNVSYGQKTDAVIEPYLSDQWFVDMKKLSEPAIKVVKDKSVKFYPEKWTKTYFHWLDNLKDWCISRQLWWGHRIPIWYHKQSAKIYCNTNPPADPENWIQDPDVLDTWFSSWLWPMSVFGWTNEKESNSNESLDYYYPTDLLVTAPDIIFLWVARMIMAAMEYKKEIPFKDVYFNSIVRDGQGRKMSKSLGNSPEPIDLMEKYGTDALRFSLIYLAPLGNDVLFDESNTELGRNFITKLWNAGRFLIMNTDSNSMQQIDANDVVSVWIESRFNSVIKKCEQYLTDYRLNDYAKTLYNFVWSEFCDWYIELLKVETVESTKQERFNFALRIYQNILILLHPVIPFVTEEIWHLVTDDSYKEKSISFERFPEYIGNLSNENIERDFQTLQELITGIRNLRAEHDIPFSKKCNLLLRSDKTKFIENFRRFIIQLSNLESLETIQNKSTVPSNTVSSVKAGFEIFLKLEGLIDPQKQREKFEREIEKLQSYLKSINGKLENEKFLEKAAHHIIEAERKKQQETLEKIQKLKGQLNYL